MEPYKVHTKIYSLEERNESEISPLWQILQILFYAFCLVFGFSVVYSFSNAHNLMQQNCLLYAKIVFEPYGNVSFSKNIKIMDSSFHNFYCQIVIYLPLSITAFASFFMVLFTICGRGGAGTRGIPNSWRLIMPSLIFNFICLCLSIYSTWIFHGGIGVFLKETVTAWGIPKAEIRHLAELTVEGIPIGFELVKYLYSSKHSLWMLLSFWGLNFSWLLLRCTFNVDFQLVRTTVYIYPKPAVVLEKPSAMYEDTSSNEVSSESATSLKDDDNQSTSSPKVRQRTVHWKRSLTSSMDKSPRFQDAATSTSTLSVVHPTPQPQDRSVIVPISDDESNSVHLSPDEDGSVTSSVKSKQ